MIAVVDYGLGNLRSVVKALERVGGEIKVTADKKEILCAQAVVLPGVGAFHRGIENLKRGGILEAILENIGKGKPFLGICLGMQLLFTESEEYGKNKGMGVIKGRVVKFSPSVKIPHMGWNQIKFHFSPLGGEEKVQFPPEEKAKIKIFEGIPDNSYFYFVHSYYVEPEDKNVVSTTTFYGKEFVSAIIKNNIFAFQFHPEKSGKLGLRILKNFVKYVEEENSN